MPGNSSPSRFQLSSAKSGLTGNGWADTRMLAGSMRSQKRRTCAGSDIGASARSMASRSGGGDGARGPSTPFASRASVSASIDPSIPTTLVNRTRGASV